MRLLPQFGMPVGIYEAVYVGTVISGAGVWGAKMDYE